MGSNLAQGLTHADTVDDHTDDEEAGEDAVEDGADERLSALCLDLREDLLVRLVVPRRELVVRVDPLQLRLRQQLEGDQDTQGQTVETGF